MVDKACPIVLRKNLDEIEILAFKHPTLFRQLVKGTIEKNELPINAAVRELAEESGLVTSGLPAYLGQSDDLPDADRWYFYMCRIEGTIPNQWSFFTEDDGGLVFDFFWHKLDNMPDEKWHFLFHDVLSFVRPLILKRCQEDSIFN